MTDRINKEQRSRIMSAVRGKNTKPELTVRKYLFSRGLRFRLHSKNLPGKPDIVLPKYKSVVFVDGCFWHAHTGCGKFRLPKSNVDFWRAKISRNVERDREVEEMLKTLGWRVVRIWECDLSDDKRNKTLAALYEKLTKETPI